MPRMGFWSAVLMTAAILAQPAFAMRYATLRATEVEQSPLGSKHAIDGLILLSGGGLFAVLLYYLRAWFAVGRDPAKGVAVPRWDAPEGLSPALVNYVDNRGFSGAGWTALSASALDLAVKGYVVLEDLKNSIVIRRTQKQAGALVEAWVKTGAACPAK